MRYTVVWTQRATMGLADLWMAAEDKASVTVATNSIDRHLAEQPLNDMKSCAVLVQPSECQLAWTSLSMSEPKP